MRICVVAPPEECLRVKADTVLFASTLCDPCLSALEAFAKKHYTNRGHLYLYLVHTADTDKQDFLSCLVRVGGVNRIIGDNSRLSSTENFETV